MQPKVIIVEPDITQEENQENLRRIEEVLQSIADELAQKINGA